MFCFVSCSDFPGQKQQKEKEKQMNENIKIALIRQHLKQAQMSIDLKIHPSRLSSIINGWTKPRQEEQEKIAGWIRNKSN